MLGRTVGHYRILRKLGEGGMGSVWVAQDLTLDRPVAIKIIAPRLAADPAARDRFLREAKAVCAMDHPGIVTLYEAWSEDDQLFAAFQYIDGSTVADLVSSGRLTLAETLRIAGEAAGALAYAHRHGIVHRDITSRNIMITREGRVKLVDFGLALPAGATRLSLSATPMGTVGYMAPEMIQDADASFPADIYGLGAVLFELLTGRLPFVGERPEAVLYLALHGEMPAPRSIVEGIPQDIDEVARQMLARDPADRPTAEEVAARLSGMHATPLPMPHPKRRNVTFAAIAAGVVLVLLGAATLGRGLIGKMRLERDQAIQSLAVLPLQDESQDPEASAYLSMGLGEALTTRLAQGTRKMVIPWVTSRRYMPPFDLTLPEIAEELHVDALIVGTFRGEADAMRANISVVDRKKGSILWVEEFQQPGRDMQALESKIALSVAKVLEGKIKSGNRESLAEPSSNSADAYDLYLKGSNTLLSGGKVAMDQALALFERAVALDPNFPEAHVGMGAVYLSRHYYGWEGGDRNLDSAETHFRQALQAKPGYLPAIRGLVRVTGQRPPGRNEDVLRFTMMFKAPEPLTIDYLLARADCFLYGQLWDCALPYLRETLRRDPNNLSAWYGFLVALVWSGKFQQATTMGDTYHGLFGNDADVDVWLGVAHYMLNDLNNARILLDESLEQSKESPDNYIHIFDGLVHRELGEEDIAKQIWREGVASFETRQSIYDTNYRVQETLLGLYCLLGAGDKYQELTKVTVWKDLETDAYCKTTAEQATALMTNLRNGTPTTLYTNIGKILGFPDLRTAPEFREYLSEVKNEQDRLRALYGDLSDLPRSALQDTKLSFGS
jgi:TolB-like protein